MAEESISKRTFLRTAAGAAASALWPNAMRADSPPNIVLILADDLGYGDLSCYGSPLSTPNIDSLASEGARFTQFYAASPVCSPSRAALLTGRYPTRIGVVGVLFPSDTTGLAESETTIAQSLKDAGYQSMCVGKWHVGSQPRYLPTNRGFGEFYGLPASGDAWPLQLMHNLDVIEQPANMSTITARFTEQAVNFIGRSKDAPFFLYLAYTAPHLPLETAPRFRRCSALGPYGDTVTELDWGVGEVLRAIRENGLDNNTLVFFTSDNGPWFQGSAGLLRGHKGDTFEGGVREPFLARFPGRIPPGVVVEDVATTMDLLPTCAGLANAPLPPLLLDGFDIWPLLTGGPGYIDRDVLLYFDAWNAQCARLGKWKLHVSRYNSVAWTPIPPGGRLNLMLPRPELYDLQADPGEHYDVAAANPAIVADIRARMERLLPTFPPQVMSSWQYSASLSVEETPSGALPVRRTP